MIKVDKIEKVENSLNILSQGLEKIVMSDGKDMKAVVRNNLQDEGTVISRDSYPGQPRGALFEAAYEGESKGKTRNAQQARSEMSNQELTMLEEEIVDRFIRDFFKDAFRGM